MLDPVYMVGVIALVCFVILIARGYDGILVTSFIGTVGTLLGYGMKK